MKVYVAVNNGPVALNVDSITKAFPKNAETVYTVEVEDGLSARAKRSAARRSVANQANRAVYDVKVGGFWTEPNQ
jgi:hypothetical protein